MSGALFPWQPFPSLSKSFFSPLAARSGLYTRIIAIFGPFKPGERADFSENVLLCTLFLGGRQLVMNGEDWYVIICLESSVRINKRRSDILLA